MMLYLKFMWWVTNPLGKVALFLVFPITLYCIIFQPQKGSNDWYLFLHEMKKKQ
jgi:hypothetical protein